MKKIIIAIILAIIVLLNYSSTAYGIETANRLQLSKEEINFLNNNKNRTFITGIDPYSGIEHFKYNGKYHGYMKPLLERMSSDLGLNFKLQSSESWNKVYSGLSDGSIDVLYGANETSERDKFMVFTRPVMKTPYAMITKKNSSIATIGDIDGVKVGFLDKDYVIEALPKLYKNIKYKSFYFNSQEDGMKALDHNLISAFITSGGPVVYDYMYRYPDLSYTFKISSITSDMTFSSIKRNKILIGIINKELAFLEKNGLPEMLSEATVDYNIKVLNLTKSETAWLKNNGTAVVGITKDYLPFDYYANGIYKGIDGALIQEISKMTGIKFSFVYSDFDDLYKSLREGKVNVLNIAKTDERLKYVIYPRPFSTERDIIVGRKDTHDVRDIFGLEGKNVAVIKGFWHYELLKKNLTKVNIIPTNSIQESMRFVHDGRADYLIENPTVVRYYIEDLQYYDLVQRGDTSTNSCLYFGVSKNMPELAGIIDKVLPMIDVGEVSLKGYEQVPHKDQNAYDRRLVLAIITLLLIIAGITAFLIKLIRDLVREKTEKELLKQREYLLSIDTLTELHNRNYFTSKLLPAMDILPYPQVLIIADMNNLKLINDKFGHQSGDALLTLFAKVLRSSCPDSNNIFRMGGDEFFIILFGADLKDAESVMESIRKFSLQESFSPDNSTACFVPCAAMGCSLRTSPDTKFDEMYKNADASMYEDKRKFKEQL